MSERTTYLMKLWRERALAAEAELAALRAEGGLRMSDCPACTWPTRETVDMVCQTCGTDYALPENAGQTPDNSTVHVMPFDDLVVHMPIEDCACGPAIEGVKREDGSMGWIYTHHSLDGRELTE